MRRLLHIILLTFCTTAVVAQSDFAELPFSTPTTYTVSIRSTLLFLGEERFPVPAECRYRIIPIVSDRFDAGRFSQWNVWRELPVDTSWEFRIFLPPGGEDWFIETFCESLLEYIPYTPAPGSIFASYVRSSVRSANHKHHWYGEGIVGNGGSYERLEKYSPKPFRESAAEGVRRLHEATRP